MIDMTPEYPVTGWMVADPSTECPWCATQLEGALSGDLVELIAAIQEHLKSCRPGKVHYHYPAACGVDELDVPGFLWSGYFDRVTCESCRAAYEEGSRS